MIRISEYVDKIVNLDKKVSIVSCLLNKNSVSLNALTHQLEIMFDLFSRSDELLEIIQNYSKTLQHDIDNLKGLYRQYENAIELANNELMEISNMLKSITDMLQDIQTNAGLFITSAQSLASLAKNTEIRAHHAKKEGRGLAIIAKECLTLAELAQLPFRNFSDLLQNLKEIAEPVITELNKTIALSSRSRELLTKSFESLNTIDETTVSLQKIIEKVEENNLINSQLKKNVSTGMDALNDQFLTSLNTIDDISMRCAQINSLSQILNTLYNILSSDGEDPPENKRNLLHLSGFEKKQYLNIQFKYFVNESIKTFSQFSVSKEPPFFPSMVYGNINDINNQINNLDASAKDLIVHKENLGSGMVEVIELSTQIELFLKETENIHTHLNKLGADLNRELAKIENLISTTNKIFTKIKTLSVYARIEEGRSIKYRDIISPIVEEFVRLEAKTEKAFLNITPQIILLTKNVLFFKKTRATTRIEKGKMPDYSKIKIFLDDIIRIFTEEKKQAKRIYGITENLYEANSTLKEAWQDYKRSISHTTQISASFNKFLRKEPFDSAAIAKARTTVSIGLPDDPLTLYPDLKTDVNSHQVICNFSSGLFQFGEGVDLIPGLCESYTISHDGTEYIFKIRPGLKFQNGKFLRIEHVKEAILRALAGPNFNFFEMITGAKEYVQTNDSISVGVTIINNSTLRIKLEYPFLPILANLATNIADPYFDDELPIGVGPFKLTSWERGKRIILSANDNYFEGRPTIDELHFLIVKDEKESYESFIKGDLSIFRPTGETLERIKSQTPQVLYTIPELSIQFLCINCQKEPFDNKSVRQAFAHAINTKRLVDTFLRNDAIPAKGIFPPSMKVYNHRVIGYEFNQRKAKDFLSNAGFKNGLPGIYPLDVSDVSSVIKRAEFIKSNLSEIGVRIEINPMPWHTLIEKTFAGDSILSFRGWVNDNGDPDNFVYSLFHSSSHGRTGNTFFFTSREIDENIDNARKIRNTDQRNLLYRRIEQKILDESPGVFLFHRLYNIAVQKNILGLKPHPLGLVRAKHIFSKNQHCPVLSDYHNGEQAKQRKRSRFVFSTR